MQNEEIRLEEKLFEVLQELGLQIERKERVKNKVEKSPHLTKGS